MKKIILPTGEEILIDEQDYKRLKQHTWHVSKGYAMTKVNRENVSMHRMIVDADEGYYVDHINHNTLDNRRCNLRIATANQNQHNRRVSHHREFKGAHRNSKVNMWEGRIGHQGKAYYLGLFADKGNAALAYDVMAQVLFSDYAHTNYQDPPKLADLVNFWLEANSLEKNIKKAPKPQVIETDNWKPVSDEIKAKIRKSTLSNYYWANKLGISEKQVAHYRVDI